MKTATESAYDDGYHAGMQGEPQEANPYPTGSDVAEAWDDGWLDSPAVQLA